MPIEISEEAYIGTRAVFAMRPPISSGYTLRSMGELDVVADTATLPALSELQHDQAYIGWTLSLQTTPGYDDVTGLGTPASGFINALR